jgi:hypothetical protein
MYSTFLIALREGLEAALIIGILVAYLVKTNQRQSLPVLWSGVGVALAASFAFGAFLSFTTTQLSKAGEQMFAGVTSLVAVVLVTYMVFWMKRVARGLKSELQGKIEYAMPLGKVALMSAAFFAVAREGLETALFVYSNFKTVSDDSSPAIGLRRAQSSPMPKAIAFSSLERIASAPALKKRWMRSNSPRGLDSECMSYFMALRKRALERNRIRPLNRPYQRAS